MPKLIEAMASWTPQVTVPDYRDPMASSTIEGLAQILLNNTAWLREFIENEVQARVQHTEATGNVHGATSTAQAGRLIARDASGRAQVASPSQPADIARLDTVTAAAAARAPVSHSHAIADVEGLQAALNSKSGSSHSHAIADVTGLQTALNGKAASSHSHAIADVTGLQTALNGKAASSHSHAIADVSGLQTALNGKAASSHSHAIADVTGLQTALNGKAASSHSHAIDSLGLSWAIVNANGTIRSSGGGGTTVVVTRQSTGRYRISAGANYANRRPTFFSPIALSNVYHSTEESSGEVVIQFLKDAAGGTVEPVDTPFMVLQLG